MQYVVMDTSISLPATLSPGGMARKLWVLLEIGRRLNPNVRDTDIQPLRRRLEAICVAGSPSFDPEDSPLFTRDRKDDPIVYTALLGEADYLISDDHDIVPNRSEHAYEYDEHQVLAVTFNRFITHHFEPPDLDWSAIDGRWLQHAFESDTTPP